MKRTIFGGAMACSAALGLSVACGTAPEPLDESAELGSVDQAVASHWSPATFKQILRSNAGEGFIRHRCSLEIPFSSVSKPMSFRVTAGGKTVELGWKGTKISEGGLTVDACPSGLGCDVMAVYRETGPSGTNFDCTIEGDDGGQQTVGSTTGAFMTVPGDHKADAIFHQHVRFEPGGNVMSSDCTFRMNADLPTAVLGNYEFLVDGIIEAEIPGAEDLGVAWKSPGSTVGLGAVTVGYGGGVTRFKHVAIRKDQISSDSLVTCAGGFFQEADVDAGTRSLGFSANVSDTRAGDGMTIGTEATEVTCTGKWGVGDGCDCDCGIVDPDCGRECIVVQPTNTSSWTIDGVAPNPTLTFVRGESYFFDVQSSNVHPFWIKTTYLDTGTDNGYPEGVSAQGVEVGVVEFTPPLIGPTPAYYQCEKHAPMSGQIDLVDP